MLVGITADEGAITDASAVSREKLGPGSVNHTTYNHK